MDGPLSGRRVAGYELREVIGRGATATVYRARQLRLGRDVAIKVLDPAFGDQPEYVERFEREGRAAAALDHPAIVTIHEAGEIDGALFLVMRLVDGTTLAERLEQSSGLDLDQTAALLRPVAEALDHAHAAGVIHRDVKPSNIFLDHAGNVVLGDFGVAGLVQGVARETVGAVGTADYMAPEQVDGAQAGAAADIYSLGCVIHECATGSPPFPRSSLLATLRAQVDDELAPTGDERLDRVLARALAKDPRQRYERAIDVIDGLIGASGSVEDSPRRGASLSHGSRGRVLVGVAMVVLVAITALLVGRLATSDDPPNDDPPNEVQAISTGSDDAAQPEEPQEQAGIEPNQGAGDGDGSEDSTVAIGPEASSEANAGADADDAVTPARTTLELGIDAAFEEFDTLNPHIEPFNTQPLIGNVLPVLYELDDHLKLTPSLAAALPEIVSDDPLVVDYELRADAVWDDGSPITAADAVATHEYILALGDQAAGRQPYTSIDRVEAISQTTVRVEFVEPHYSYGLFLSSNHPVFPASVIEDHLALGGDPVDLLNAEINFSGGPFSLSGAELGDGPGAGVELRFTRNQAYWGDPAPLERITLRNYQGLADTIDAVATGDVAAAFLRRPTIGTVDEIESIEGVSVRADAVGPSAIALFTSQPRLGAEPTIRQAVIAAIDREALATAVLGPAVGGRVEPLDSLAWLPQHDRGPGPFDGIGGDPDAAQRILADGGWTLVEGDPVDRWERDGEGLRLTLIIERQPPVGQLGASVPIQLFNDLEAAGIQLEAFALDTADYADRTARGDYDIRIAFTPTLTDPTANLVWFGGADRPFGYVGPAAEMIRESEVTIDLDERHALVDAAELDLVASAFALPLFQAAALTVAPATTSIPTPNGRLGGPLIDLPAWGAPP